MQLHPTRAGAHLAIASTVVVAIGVLSGEAAIVGWGGAILVAVAIARAATLVSVARIRAAGFEMLWSGTQRTARTHRGAIVELEAEVRNRDTLAARYVKLRALASPNLEVTILPERGEVVAGGRLKVKVRVHCPRVGQHGVHGLALEVHGAPGMFEVPLTFANPFGVEVLPRSLGLYMTTPRGGRSKALAPSGRAGNVRGEGDELRELRDHVPGDPFRRIAWKASARRGRLVVREMEREERDIVWVVVDASTELWSGPPGKAPLDQMIDHAAAIATRHLGRGDRVGLCVVASTLRAWLPPEVGPGQAQKIAWALLAAAATHDAERSDLDELDVAVRVIEHLRPLDANGLSDVRRNDLDKLSERAESMRPRAPFRVKRPSARSPREQILRRYLASFGVDSPAKTEGERRETARELAAALGRLGKEKPRPSLVHVLAQGPEGEWEGPLKDAITKLRRRGARMSWVLPSYDAALDVPRDATKPRAEANEAESRSPNALGDAAPVAALAVRVRASLALELQERELGRLGVRLARLRSPGRPALSAELPAASAPRGGGGDAS
jgi:uncharacterized protein (DUF58 family)